MNRSRQNMIQIRPADDRDRDAIRSVHISAFPDGEGRIVAKLAADLLGEEVTPPIFSLVADIEGRVAGHVALSPVTVAGEDPVRGYLLAPLGVGSGHQKLGIGSRLVRAGMQQLSEMGVDVLLVYGDPAYHGRFGFRPETAESFVPPYRLQFPFGWQGVVLSGHPLPGAPVAITCVTSLCDPELW